MNTRCLKGRLGTNPQENQVFQAYSEYMNYCEVEDIMIQESRGTTRLSLPVFKKGSEKVRERKVRVGLLGRSKGL